jgi:hypothetical protein
VRSFILGHPGALFWGIWVFNQEGRIMDRKRETKLEGNLAGIDRSKLGGFKRYWKERQDYFKNQFGMEYKAETVNEAYKRQMETFNGPWVIS